MYSIILSQEVHKFEVKQMRVTLEIFAVIANICDFANIANICDRKYLRSTRISDRKYLRF